MTKAAPAYPLRGGTGANFLLPGLSLMHASPCIVISRKEVNMKEILDGLAAVITAVGGLMLGAAALITALRRGKDKNRK